MFRSSFLFVLSLSAALAACSDDPTFIYQPPPDATDDAAADASGDVASDVPESDAGDDASADVEEDAADTGEDVPTDAPVDGDAANNDASDSAADILDDTPNDVGTDTDAPDDIDVVEDTDVVEDPDTDVIEDTDTDADVDEDPDTDVVDDTDADVDVDPDTDTDVDEDPDTDTDVAEDPDTDTDVDVVPDCLSVAEARGLIGLVDFTLCPAVVTYVWDVGFVVQEPALEGAAIVVYEGDLWTNPDGLLVGDTISMPVTEIIDFNGTLEISAHGAPTLHSTGFPVSSLIVNMSAGTLPSEVLEAHVVRVNDAQVQSVSGRNIYIDYGTAEFILVRMASESSFCPGTEFDLRALVTEWTPEGVHRFQSYLPSDFSDIDNSACESGLRDATTADLVINEVLADPPPDLSGDANCDGTRHGVEDEFVEIVNRASVGVDMGGVTLSDTTGDRYTFPVGSTLGAGEAVVVFGGGDPALFGCSFGGANVAIAPSGLGLNNDADVLRLETSDGDFITFDWTVGEMDADQSRTRSPDITGPFTPHASATGSGSAPFSAGARVNGTPF